MKKVESVAKDGQLGFGKNTFRIVTHDKVLNVTRKHFIDAEVIIIPIQRDKGVSVAGKTSKGTDKIRFEAVYDVEFIAIEDGSKLVVTSEAHAEDSSDKAANKALTYAVKNAILKVLSLQSNDDVNEEAQNKISAQQIKMLKSLITKTKSDEAQFLATYSAEKFEDINEAMFTHALALLNKKAAK